MDQREMANDDMAFAKIIAVQDFKHYYNQIITHSIHIYSGIVRWIDVNGFDISKPK